MIYTTHGAMTAADMADMADLYDLGLEAREAQAEEEAMEQAHEEHAAQCRACRELDEQRAFQARQTLAQDNARRALEAGIRAGLKAMPLANSGPARMILQEALEEAQKALRSI